MSFSKKVSYEYPFGRRWVYASLGMSLIAIIFAVFMLSGEGSLALLLYFGVTSLFTAAVLVVKFYLYFLRNRRSPETYSSEDEGEVPRRLKWAFIALVALAILALFVPLILLVILSPLWWLISITSYVPAVNIPEIILYIISLRKNRE